MSKLLCIIPARGGSKRIPHKNILPFKGKPIIAYTIETVKASGIANEIMVSTDDKEIAEIAMQYGASYPFRRDDKTANDVCGVADVLVEEVTSLLLMCPKRFDKYMKKSFRMGDLLHMDYIKKRMPSRSF